jgi:cell division protein FtsW
MQRTWLVIVTSILFALGLVMVFNTSSAEILDLDLDRNTHLAIFKQVATALIGCLLAYGVGKAGLRRFIRISPFCLLALTALLFLCFVPGIGKSVNGSHRWIVLGGLSFQPSEFVKYMIPAYFIARLSKGGDHSIHFFAFFKVAAILSVPIFLILIEPNNGTAGVLVMTIGALSVLAKISWKYWALPLLVVFIVGGVSASQLPYVQARLKVYLNPELDLRGRGHQPHQAKIAAGSGQLWGKGPGNSLQKLSYLPEAQNDYIAAIYAEEFGFVGMFFLIFLYLLFAYFGFSMSFTASSREECWMAASVTFLIAFQAFLNLGVVSGLLPSTGLNLPFFSQGGSSLIANITGLGFILNIQTREDDVKKSVDRRWRIRRPCISRPSAG